LNDPARKDEKRRLPVLNSAPHDEPDEERPPWHWSAIGVVAIFVVWLPLAYVANGVVARALREGASAATSAPVRVVAVMIGSNVLAFGVAAFAGGFIVARFGAKAGRREATVSGFAAGAIAWALSFASLLAAPRAMAPDMTMVAANWLVLLAVMGALGAGVANLGGRLGLRMRGPR
jgi:hypothetical protein